MTVMNAESIGKDFSPGIEKPGFFNRLLMSCALTPFNFDLHCY